MNIFWKEHPAARICTILILFVLGLALVIYGFTKPGQLYALGLMLIGLALLVGALTVYNQAFQDRKKDRH